MNLNVSGHQFDVTPAIRKYVNSKLGRVIRHFDHVIDAHVILSVSKLRQKAEVTLRRGKASTAMRGRRLPAIDLLGDKLIARS